MTVLSRKKIISQAGGSGINSSVQTALGIENDFRLTLTSGVAVTTTDIVNASTIYCTPFNGNKISLYDGTKWVTYSSAEFSIALGTLTNNVGYDVFCYANAGVPTLELLAWTSATVRATALVLQNGVDCKSGDLTRKYLGSFLNIGNKTGTVTITNASPAVVTFTGHGLAANSPVVLATDGVLPTGITAGLTYYVSRVGTATVDTFNISLTPGGVVINTSSAGSGTHTATVPTFIEDSDCNRNLSNNYNKVNRRLYKDLFSEPSSTWNYTLATYRQTNANILNQVNFFQGKDSLVSLLHQPRVGSSAAVGTLLSAGIGLDSITTPSIALSIANPIALAAAPTTYNVVFLDYTGVGKHYLSTLEYSTASGTATWYRFYVRGTILG